MADPRVHTSWLVDLILSPNLAALSTSPSRKRSSILESQGYSYIAGGLRTAKLTVHSSSSGRPAARPSNY